MHVVGDEAFRAHYPEFYTSLAKVTVTLKDTKSDHSTGEKMTLEKTRAPLRRMTMVVTRALGDLVNGEFITEDRTQSDKMDLVDVANFAMEIRLRTSVRSSSVDQYKS